MVKQMMAYKEVPMHKSNKGLSQLVIIELVLQTSDFVELILLKLVETIDELLFAKQIMHQFVVYSHFRLREEVFNK
jgi:hypothetical protein